MSQEEMGLRQAVIDACLRLEAEGYLIGTYGNASVRVSDGLLVTPSRVAYRDMQPQDLVRVSLDGHVLQGDSLPSSETAVHRLIYAARSDVGAVLHTHALHATALSCLRAPAPPIVEEQSQVIGGAIPCTNYVPAGQHEALGAEVARALGASNVVLLANHGLVACGRDLPEALFTTHIAERVAQMHLLTAGGGPAIPIEAEHVASERDRWLHRYGTALDHEAES